MDPRYAPRPLSSSREYPAYQFYARLRFDGRTADECFRYAALTVQNWLCERIRKSGGEPPGELRCASASDYRNVSSDALRSCKLQYLEVIAIPDEGIWSCMVREPHPDIPARSFVTHAGIQMTDGQDVEFGVNIDVVDRDASLPEQDRAYRPQFIRLLFETEGMRLAQAQDLVYKRYIEIRTRKDVARLKTLTDDRENQLPLVVFTHAHQESSRPADLERILADAMAVPSPGRLDLQKVPPVVGKDSAPATYCLPYDVGELSKHLYGYAQAYVAFPEVFDDLRARFGRSRINEGDILIIEPKDFGGETGTIPYRDGLKPEWYRSVTDDLQASLQRYSKHKPFRYGNVMFVEDARQRVRELELRDLRSLIDSEKGGEKQKLLDQLEAERSLSAELREQNRKLRDQMRDEYLRGEEQNHLKIRSLEEAVAGYKADVADLTSKNEAMAQGFTEFSAMKAIAGRVQSIREMPETNADVVRYFSLMFEDRLAFTERGAKTAEKCDVKPAVLWSCLYLVATVLADLYRDGVPDTDRQFKKITGWDLATSEGAQTRKIQDFMNLRKDVYEGREISIEPHVKFKKSERKTGAQYQRLHYAYDPLTRKIVVGYVGDHLENYLSLSTH